ncbi:Ganglioside-induced differentiation-associated protein 2 [Phytophthora boehmeriae]|uniref:Ganglioside-induced differentiation-associated protein 2 n=1 Tax=Phytophthora boehmeriae TaxID=109152 RepID=A0A8T1XC63_9STRA|nr:Ganglioside-induced differentiation-associated protein 2 [Phytophthora boehmeriae]
MADCYELLATTYENVMNAVQNENLTTIAMASISTGELSIPCEEAAQVALRTIQKLLRGSNWRGKLAVVCYDEHVFRAFSSKREVVMKDFNADPPLPVNNFEEFFAAQAE